MVGWWGMDIGRPTREAFAGTVMWDDDCLDQDIGGGNDKKAMDLSYLLKTESTGVDKHWMRGPCPCKQDPIKSRDEEDSPWNQTSTYLSPGSAMHLPGHLGALPAQCLWCLRTLGLILPKLLSVHSLSSCWDSNSTLVLRGPDTGSRGQPRRLQIVLQEGRNNVGFSDQEFETEGRNTLY